MLTRCTCVDFVAKREGADGGASNCVVHTKRTYGPGLHACGSLVPWFVQSNAGPGKQTCGLGVAQGDQLDGEVALCWFEQREICAQDADLWHRGCPGRPAGFGGSDVRA